MVLAGVIFILVHRMVKVGPTSSSFVLVWNTPVAPFGTHAHTQKHCHDFEGAQRRAARFVKNCYEREPVTVRRTNLLGRGRVVQLAQLR